MLWLSLLLLHGLLLLLLIACDSETPSQHEIRLVDLGRGERVEGLLLLLLRLSSTLFI